MIRFPCPPSDRWKALLRDDLPASEQAALDAHLEDCPDCQRALDECAASRADWSGAREIRPAASGEAALRTVMDRLKGTPTIEAVEESAMTFDMLDPSDRPGSLGRINGYEILEEIGRGGMGIVYKALDPALHRVVAIKVLAPQLAVSGTARVRFTREARAAAAISHEHVVAIHAVEEFKGLPYLVMNYVAGVSLQEKLVANGPLKVQEILRIGMQVADGLAAAHAQGIVHRDVKPANILLENGVERVKLTDFSLARAIDDASVTQSGVITGTPQYMAPEQTRGEPLDARADLFSLGSVLYALCTGRAPFRGNAIEVLRKVAEVTPVPIRELNPEIPEWLEAIVAKLMSKEPGERFASAADVTALLARCLAHVQQPNQVALPPIPGLRRRWPRRAKVALAAMIALGLFAVSEATGQTQVIQAAATILRLKVDDGTLIVEVDDPNVKITLDGKDLVITGAGPQEVRLKPGRYELKATKDGKPVKEELVEITQGGKRTVRVTFEGTAQASRIDPRSPDTRLLLEQFQYQKALADAAVAKANEELAQEKAKEAKPVEKKYRMEFRETRWRDVLQWFGETLNLPVVTQYWPGGIFTFAPERAPGGVPREYTVREIFDILNDALLPQKLLLIRREHSLTVVPADERVDRALVPQIKLDELPSRGKSELVTVVLTLKSPKVAEVTSDIRKLLGPFGAVVTLGQSKLVLTDTAGNLTRILELLRSGLDTEPAGAVDAGTYKCAHIKAHEAARALNEYFAQSFDPKKPDSERIKITVDESSNSVLFSGPPHLVGEAKQILLKLDAPASGPKPRSAIPQIADPLDAARADAAEAAQRAAEILIPIGTIIREPRRVFPTGQRAPIIAVAQSPDGKLVISAALDGSIKVIDLTTGKPVVEVAGRTSNLSAAGMAPDGSLFATSDQRGGSVTMWDPRNGKLVRNLGDHSGVITAIAFSSDSKILVSGTASSNGGQLRFLDAETGRVRSTLAATHGVTALAFTSDGRELIAGIDREAMRIAVADGKLLGGETLPSRIRQIAIDPSGKLIAIAHGERDGHIRLYRSTGMILGTNLGTIRVDEDHSILSLAFSHDGTKLAAGFDGAGKVKVWEVSERSRHEDAGASEPAANRVVLLQPIATFIPIVESGRDAGATSAVTFLHHGLAVLAAGDDGIIRHWDVPPTKTRP